MRKRRGRRFQRILDRFRVEKRKRNHCVDIELRVIAVLIVPQPCCSIQSTEE